MLLMTPGPSLLGGLPPPPPSPYQSAASSLGGLSPFLSRREEPHPPPLPTASFLPPPPPGALTVPPSMYAGGGMMYGPATAAAIQRSDSDDEDSDDGDRNDDGVDAGHGAQRPGQAVATEKKRRSRTGIDRETRKRQDIASAHQLLERLLIPIRDLWTRGIEDTFVYPKTRSEMLRRHLPGGTDASLEFLKRCSDPHVHHTFFDSYCTELREETFKLADALQRKLRSLIWGLRHRVIGNRKKNFGRPVDFLSAPRSSAQIELATAAAASSTPTATAVANANAVSKTTTGVRGLSKAAAAAACKGTCVPDSFAMVLGTGDRRAPIGRRIPPTSSSTAPLSDTMMSTSTPMPPLVCAGTQQTYERARLLAVKMPPGTRSRQKEPLLPPTQLPPPAPGDGKFVIGSRGPSFQYVSMLSPVAAPSSRTGLPQSAVLPQNGSSMLAAPSSHSGLPQSALLPQNGLSMLAAPSSHSGLPQSALLPQNGLSMLAAVAARPGRTSVDADGFAIPLPIPPPSSASSSRPHVPPLVTRSH